jgi:D-serine deaminase-like pyridoxal phosphate-dependent protein
MELSNPRAGTVEIKALRPSDLLPVPEVRGIEGIRTPALVIDLDAVDANLDATIRLLNGDPNRWRPHLKSAKLGMIMRRIKDRGVLQAKTSTTLELETACAAGFTDVLLAYPVTGPQVDLVKRIAADHPGTAISVLVEDAAMVAAWRGSSIGLFIDLNSGMDRTGMLLDGHDEVIGLVRGIQAAGLRFAGLHFYDGHASDFSSAEAAGRVHGGYDRLLALVERIKATGVATPEVVTAGTPAFPHAVTYRRFVEAGTVHRVSPGTVVYNDCRSLDQLPRRAGYRPAAFVLSRVVSHPGPARFCTDAGHKTISADAGVPTCSILGHPDYSPRHPSEEHLPVDVPPGTALPRRGEMLWMLPSHVCPTVNNFDHAVVVKDGAIQGLEPVTARGRHAPIG